MKKKLAEITALIIVLVAVITAITNQTAFAQKGVSYPYPSAYAPPIGQYDGWILEQTETSNTGGKLSSIGTVLIVGDNATDRQYKSILNFDTGVALPDDAVITKAFMYLRQTGSTGINPFRSLGTIWVDVRYPYFGSQRALELGDFQAGTSGYRVGNFGYLPIEGWHVAEIKDPNVYISKTVATQFRIYFGKGDNDNGIADTLRFSSADGLSKAYYPRLEIKYYVR